MNQRGVEQLRTAYQAYRQELFGYAYALTRCAATAEDAVHSAFEGVLKRAALPRELRPFLFRCIRNAALDVRCRAARDATQAVPPGGAIVPLSGLRLDLEAALNALGEDERETIVLKTYGGLTFEEIAAVREVSVNTAASWYRRGLEKLRKRFEEAEV